MNKEKLKNIFLYFIIIQPVLDLITSLSNTYLSLPVSLNIIIKVLFLIVTFVYVLKFSKSKYRKPSIIYYIIFITFSLFYFIFKLDLYTIGNYLNELTYLFKFNYWVFLLIGYVNLFSDNTLDKNKLIKCLEIDAVLYFLFLIIPLITNTSLASYDERVMGHKGWFYAANELACLLSLLIPLLLLMFKKEKRNWFDYASLVCGIIAMLSIGLKTTFASLILTTLIIFIYLFIRNKKNPKFYIIVALIVGIFALTYKYIPGFDIWKNTNYAASLEKEENDNLVDTFTKILFHARKPLFIEKKEIYDVAPIQDKLFGIGFTDRDTYKDMRVYKLVEIDPADIFFGYGIVGYIIHLIPFIYLGYILIKNKMKNILKFENYISFYVVLLSIFISIFAGHVFGAPSVPIYTIIAYMILLLNFDSNEKSSDKNVSSHKKIKKRD